MKVPWANEKNPQVLAVAIRHLAEGRSNAAGQVTLRANETTTTVTSDVISAGCFPLLTPASATAATAMGAGAVYVSAVANGSFVITHNSTADVDRTFHWFAVGG